MSRYYDEERLLKLLDAHYSILRARAWLLSSPLLKDGDVDVLLGAAIELMIERLHPAVSGANFQSPDCLYDIRFVKSCHDVLMDLHFGQINETNADYGLADQVLEGMRFVPRKVTRERYIDAIREVKRRASEGGEEATPENDGNGAEDA